LNHDNNTPATAFAITQGSIQDSEESQFPALQVQGISGFNEPANCNQVSTV
jgi:hypothetical protein